jgi:hypothetical protein
LDAIAPATDDNATVIPTAAADAPAATTSPEADNIADQLAELEERAEDLASCEKHLDLYTRHLLRKALSSTITIEFLEQLKVNPSRVHLIIDYKQKVLPERHRATQTEAFGKRGKSLHGCTALRWDALKGDFNVINIRVACDDANQTWFHTLNALRTTLDELLKLWPDVNEATLQSDGANNYDCTAFMASAPDLFRATNIKLRRHSITEVGDGKNLQDTDFQQAQMALNHGLDGGRNFEDAQVLRAQSLCLNPILHCQTSFALAPSILQGILDTLEANKTLGVINVGMKLGARTLEPKSGQGPKAYTGIDSFYDREYEYDSGDRFTGVRLRKFFGLGAGRLVTAVQVRALWRQDFDASQVDPERMRPDSCGGAAAAKVKRSHEHNLQHFQQKRFRKQQRDAHAAAEARAVLEEEHNHSLRVTTFVCKHKHEGCPHRPFLTQAGADAHARSCEFSGAGKRLPNQCYVKLRVRPRRIDEKLVTLKLGNTLGNITASLKVAKDVFTSIKVLRPLAPDKPYGLHEHRALVHHRTETAQQCAACTVVSERVSLVLKVGLIGSPQSAEGSIVSRSQGIQTPTTSRARLGNSPTTGAQALLSRAAKLSCGAVRLAAWPAERTPGLR